MQEIPITFEVPNATEPIELVRGLAQSFKGLSPRGGENYTVSEDTAPTVDGCIQIRVFAPRGKRFYQQALWCLTAVDVWCLRSCMKSGAKRYAPLYQSICYVREPAGVEVWQSLPALYQRKIGDCEDLTCARVAERILVGDACKPTLIGKPKKGGGILYHVVVKNPDGSLEDPSAILGMRLGRNGDRTSARCSRLLGPGQVANQS